MFKGVYRGKRAKKMKKRVLILGESHYSDGKSENYNDYTTEKVMENYKKFPTEKCYSFFHKIAQSFNVNTNDVNQEFSKFWDNVYFGNYIPVFCGIKDSKAKAYLKNGNRKECNNQLFDYINREGIDIVFVFSRLSYNNMPSLSKQYFSEENLENIGDNTLQVNERRDWIGCCKYLADIEHKNVDIILKKDITVYSMRHPSARGGYCIENYKGILGSIIKELEV